MWHSMRSALLRHKIAGFFSSLLGEDLLEGVKRVRNGVNGAEGWLGERSTGFTPLASAAKA
jgi:hypothetical protein